MQQFMGQIGKTKSVYAITFSMYVMEVCVCVCVKIDLIMTSHINMSHVPPYEGRMTNFCEYWHRSLDLY